MAFNRLLRLGTRVANRTICGRHGAPPTKAGRALIEAAEWPIFIKVHSDGTLVQGLHDRAKAVSEGDREPVARDVNLNWLTSVTSVHRGSSTAG